jgi:precorrin-6A/cobalt-precorrin-6A reductase
MENTQTTDVLVIAGTIDARNIIEELLKLKKRVAATVTTDFGSKLLEEYNGLRVHEGKLTDIGMLELIRSTGSRCLIDASHPYAKEASINAIKASKLAFVPYIRFERGATRPQEENTLWVKDFIEAANKASSLDGNILLTIGSNHIETFVESVPQYKKRLYARVLPDSGMLAKCEDAGLTAENIIAMKGPFSEEMNLAMLKHCNAKVLVTKDSGDAGGTSEKLTAARKLGINVIIVERPEVQYPNKVDSIAEVIRQVENLLK